MSGSTKRTQTPPPSSPLKKRRTVEEFFDYDAYLGKCPTLERRSWDFVDHDNIRTVLGPEKLTEFLRLALLDPNLKENYYNLLYDQQDGDLQESDSE